MVEVESLSPTAAQRRQQLRECNVGKRAELQDIFTDPSYTFAKNVETFVSQHPDKVNEIAHSNRVEVFYYDTDDDPRRTGLDNKQRVQNHIFSARRGFFDHTDGRYQRYLRMTTSSPYHVASEIRVPIAEYGEKFAERLIRTWMFLVEFAGYDYQTHDELFEKVDNHRPVAKHHMIRSLDRHHPGPEEGSIGSLQEGIGAMFSLIVQHTAEKVAGYEEDSRGALRLVCASDLINSTTGDAHLGYADPMSRYGLYITHPNEIKSGRLTTSSKLKDSLGEMSELSEAIEYDRWVSYFQEVESGKVDAVLPVRFGLKCPAFGPYTRTSGETVPGTISRITSLIPMVYDCIDIDSEIEGRSSGEIPLLINPGLEPMGNTFLERIAQLREGQVLPQARLNPKTPRDIITY